MVVVHGAEVMVEVDKSAKLGRVRASRLSWRRKGGEVRLGGKDWTDLVVARVARAARRTLLRIVVGEVEIGRVMRKSIGRFEA